MAAIPDVSDAKMVLVTDEPMGGSDEPTRTPVMTASPVLKRPEGTRC